jgi:hypothetical protein
MKRSSLLVLYVVSFLVGTAIFVDLFHTALFSWLDVFFYRGIVLLGVAGLFVGASLFVVRRLIPGVISLKDVYIILLTLISVNLLFFTHVPVTAERSISIFLLGQMNTNADKIITKENLSQAFSEEYMGIDDGIEKRIHEQLVSGNIAQKGSGYQLTTRGKLLMKMYMVVADVFGIDKRIVAPK